MSSLFLPPALIAALLTFVVVNSFTPGPNNIMLTASGVNFGLRRTGPHMAGIFTGLVLVTLAVSFGLGLVFSRYPLVRAGLAAAGVLYTLWLAWKIATAGSLGGGALAQPMRFAAALAFQWVNPKLWVMVIATVALYVRPGHVMADAPLVTLVIAGVNIPSMLVWAGFGAGLSTWLRGPGRIRIFNLAMGLLLAASILPLLRM